MNRLPVHERAYDLTLWLARAVVDFSRQQRYLLGERIESAALGLLDVLLEAQTSPETRAAALRRASVCVNRLTHMLRLANDLELLSVKRYEYGCRALVEVGRHRSLSR